MVKKLKWTPGLVKKFWNGVAQTPLDRLSFGRLAGPALLDIIAPHLREGGRHLDYGAGSGHLTQLLLERGYATAAYEPSARRAKELKKRIGHLSSFLGVVDARSADVFDVVLVAEVVEHLPDEGLESTLSRINRFLAPGGTVIVTTPNNENLQDASVYCPVSDTLYHPWQHVRSFTPESISKLMTHYGFEQIFLGTVDFSADCEVHEAFKRSHKVESAMIEVLERLLREQREYHTQLLAAEKHALQEALTEQLRAMTVALEAQRQKQAEQDTASVAVQREIAASIDEQRKNQAAHLQSIQNVVSELVGDLTRTLEDYRQKLTTHDDLMVAIQKDFAAFLEQQRDTLPQLMDNCFLKQEAAAAESRRSFSALLEQKETVHCEALQKVTAALAEQRQTHLHTLEDLSARQQSSTEEAEGVFRKLVEDSRKASELQKHAAARVKEREVLLLTFYRELLQRLAEIERTTLIGRIKWLLFRKRREAHYNGMLDRIALLEGDFGQDISVTSASWLDTGNRIDRDSK